VDLELEDAGGPLTLVGKLYWSDIFEQVQETVVREDDGDVSRFGLYVDSAGSVLAAPVFLLAELEPLRTHGLFAGDAVPSPAAARSIRTVVGDSTYALVVARAQENPTPDPPRGGYAGWDANVLLFEKPEIATAPLEAFARASLAVLLFAAGLSLLLARVFAKRLTVQLGLLVDATEVMRAGRRPERVRVLVRNELGALTTQFNRMVDEIADNRAALEHRASEMEAANRRLRELDELKTRLLSNVSHELRTPLAAITAAAKAIAKYHATKPEVSERFSATIVTESDRLGRLIDDFLDLTKIETGSMPWSDSAVLVNEVIEEVVDRFTPLFEEKQILVSAEVEPELLPLWMDRDRLVQLLTNLLSNAAKYTPAGGHVTVSAVRSQGGVTVAVADSGEGIAEDELEKIFDKFYQVKTGHGLGLQATGTGLGLAVCKDIVEHYRGRIWVESTRGVGSAFKFTVPTGRYNGAGEADGPPADVEQETESSSTSA
ncbi:MAG: ATP-binding protein, partial [Candidatus Binatia bacterium]